jgi:hypothetical protein
MRPPTQFAVLFPGFKQPDQLVGDHRSGDLSHNTATPARLERFVQIAGRMDRVATVQFFLASFRLLGGARTAGFRHRAETDRGCSL